MVSGTKMLPDQLGRRRVQHRFDLNLNKEDEYQLHEIIRALKKKRSFLGVIRDGIRLILDLRQGQTDVLRELFPWVFEQHIREVDNTQFEELRRLISQGLAQPAPALQPLSSSLNAPSADEDTIVIKEQTVSEDLNPGWNLRINMAMMGGDLSTLTSEMIWYGIRNGHINVQALLGKGLLTFEQIEDGVAKGKVDPQKLPDSVRRKVNNLAENSGPKPLKGADVILPEPDFDDL